MNKWNHIGTFKAYDDYSKYKWETSSNGGDYAYSGYLDWYMRKLDDGNMEFAFVETHNTSADFSFDELAGTFQQDLGTLTLEGTVEGSPEYRTQWAIEYDKEGNKSYDSSIPFEKIATMSTFEELWKMQYQRIEYDEDQSYVENALSFSDKKKIIAKISCL